MVLDDSGLILEDHQDIATTNTDSIAMKSFHSNNLTLEQLVHTQMLLHSHSQVGEWST